MKRGLLIILLTVIVTPVFYSSDIMAGPSGHRELSATVKKIDGNLVSVRTEEGTTRYFTVTEAEKNGLQPLYPGNTVVIELDEGNQIIDIHGPNHGADRHTSLTGTVENLRPSDKVMTFRTEDGENKIFELKDSVILKLDTFSEGVQLTLEIDEQNRVIDAHRGEG